MKKATKEATNISFHIVFDRIPLGGWIGIGIGSVSVLLLIVGGVVLLIIYLRRRSSYANYQMVGVPDVKSYR